MPKERPNLALNPVEAAAERLRRQKPECVRSLVPDRDLTWESTEDFQFTEDNEHDYYS